MATLTSTSEDTRIYEFCILYPPNLPQKEENALLNDVEQLIEEAGGTQVAKDLWGKRGLAYRIGGYDEGCYVVYYYDLDPTAIKELEEALRIMPNVLRHLIVKPPKGYEIVKYSEKYEQWLKDKEKEEEQKEQERERQLQKKVAEKAKRQAARAAKSKKTEDQKEAPPKTDSKKISEELDKFISDDDLDL